MKATSGHHYFFDFVMATTNDQTTQRTCPCKRLPLALSTLTGAEWGDVHSLQRRGRLLGDDISKRQDSAGNTALHLAAQHGHVAATALLLDFTADVNAHHASGATPLHRASFSGAVGTMRLLLNRADADLFLPDTSFGDRRTALHKAAAGGRYLAVQLLLQVHAERGTLRMALASRDAGGQTPLEVAQSLQSRQDEERQSVARWDAVAGGVADWQLCCEILQEATRNGTVVATAPGVADSINKSVASTLPNALTANEDCADCETDVCVTKSWEQAFQRGLMQAISRQNTLKPAQNDADRSDAKTVNETEAEMALACNQQEESRLETSNCPGSSSSSQLGRPCDACTKQSLFLYPSDGKLVCRACKRANR